MKTIDKKDFKVTYNDSKEVKDAIFDYLMKNFYMRYEKFSGESIAQNDDTQIYAHEVLGDIADKIIKFEWEWK